MRKLFFCAASLIVAAAFCLPSWSQDQEQSKWQQLPNMNDVFIAGSVKDENIDIDILVADDLPPSRALTRSVVESVGPDELVDAVRVRLGTRAPEQRAVAEARLGVIDGGATRRLSARIRALLTEPARGGDAGDPRDVDSL